MSQSLFKKGSRAYKMAFPSERALKRRSNMVNRDLANFLFVAAMIQTNQIKTT